MGHEAEFVKLQRAFSRYLRDPENVAPPAGHEARRLAVYRHAVYANVATSLSDNYPRVQAIMNAQNWQELVRDYIIRHTVTANAFVDVPAEFLTYLKNERASLNDPPCIAELAHFDWLEGALGADRREFPLTQFLRDGDLMHGIPLANPVMELVTYQFPVHVINADFLPLSPPQRPTHIAAFRALNDAYGFLDLNAAAARLLEVVMRGEGYTGAEIFAQMARELDAEDDHAMTTYCMTILERMRASGAILGTRHQANDELT
jgi:hypothetical protein